MPATFSNEAIHLEEMHFGPAGYPADTHGSPRKAFQMIREAGLDAMEYAAVYGLRISEERAAALGALAEENGIIMSMHAAYYISLASKSDEIRSRSKERLVAGLRFAPMMRVKRIVFHAGGYCGLAPEDAYKVVGDSLREVGAAVGRRGKGALLAPETAGKLGAFGSVEELVKLCSEDDCLIPTIDWAHLHARTQGQMDNKDSYLRVLDTFERELGDRFVDNMHFHVSGIEYSQGGEKAHRPLGHKWGPDILPLLQIVKEVGYRPTFISETPNPIHGALYTKLLFDELEKSTQ